MTESDAPQAPDTAPDALRGLLEWAIAERSEWHRNNADRYWQMGRVITKIRAAFTTASARTGEPSADDPYASVGGEAAYWEGVLDRAQTRLGEILGEPDGEIFDMLDGLALRFGEPSAAPRRPDDVWYLAHPVSPDDRFTFEQNMEHALKVARICHDAGFKVCLPWYADCRYLDDTNAEHRAAGLATPPASTRPAEMDLREILREAIESAGELQEQYDRRYRDASNGLDSRTQYDEIMVRRNAAVEWFTAAHDAILDHAVAQISARPADGAEPTLEEAP